MGRDRIDIARVSARLLGLVAIVSLVLVPFASTAQGANKTNATFTYSCCTASFVNSPYHPGEVMRLPWTRTAHVPGALKTEMVTLSATITGPYKTVALLKTAFARHTPRLGEFNAKAAQIRVSDASGKRCFQLVKVPDVATAGFYELTTSVTTHSLVTSEGTVFRVS